MSRSDPSGSGLWLAVGAAALFAVSGVVAASAFDVVSPVQMTRFRLVVTAVLLGAVATHRRQLVSRGSRGRLVVLGVSLASVTVNYYIAIDHLGVGPGVTLQFLGPALVLVWMRFFQHRRVPILAWVAAGVAVAGTALMTEAWDVASSDTTGVAAGLAAAVSLAVYLVVAEDLGRRLPSLSVAAHGFAIAALIWVVAAPVPLPAVGAKVWAQMTWVAVAGTAVPFLMEFAALRRADPGRVGVLATAEPVFSALIAWPVLGQALSPAQAAGGALVVGGIAMIQWVTRAGPPTVPSSEPSGDDHGLRAR